MDRRTLFTVQAGLLIFLGGVILASSYFQSRNRRDKGSVWFAAAYFCAGLGLGLQAYRGQISDVISILFGNGLFLMFGPLANRAIAKTTDQKRDYLVWLLLLNAATVMNYAYYTWWQPNVVLRTVEAVPILAVMYLACIDLLLRNKDEVIRPAVNAIIVCFAMQSLPNFVRVALAWKYQIPDAWFSWSGIITIAGLALSYLWIGNLRMHAELERSAMTDPLTGLFNRRALDVFAMRELERIRRRNLPCSALMMDVDSFKQINDGLGHAAGDASLCAVADTLQKTLRLTDIATRLGGDEFFVLLPDCSEAQATEVVMRLKSAIHGLRLKTMSEVVFTISTSIGCVTLSGQDATLEELLHGSDMMLYREKQALRAETSPEMKPQPVPVPGPRRVQPYNA
ncbi:GGDEF domain-containing protein [Terriglobus sp. TAA 43]|uniref:GGDEF domain-containing protein n=1 Tax=Terriglobus sp. TAA 43 TaxID=278961 RepID=UPI000A0458DA|nr:GGDEF domain-containing protein [Terriglobus sp. TAA 43]